MFAVYSSADVYMSLFSFLVTIEMPAIMVAAISIALLECNQLAFSEERLGAITSLYLSFPVMSVAVMLAAVCIIALFNG